MSLQHRGEIEGQRRHPLTIIGFKNFPISFASTNPLSSMPSPCDALVCQHNCGPSQDRQRASKTRRLHTSCWHKTGWSYQRCCISYDSGIQSSKQRWVYHSPLAESLQ